MMDTYKNSPTRNGEWMPKHETPEKEWAPYVENSRSPALLQRMPGYLLHPLDPGFNIENFDESHIWPLLNAPEYEHAYKFYFAGKDHEIWVNSIDDAAVGPVIVCCEKHSPQSLKLSLKVLIQSKKGAERSQLATSIVNEMGIQKALSTLKPDFAKIKLKQVGRAVEKALMVYEEQIVRNVYKFGVLYCKEGQDQEDEMYNNEHGSEAFEEFLNLLGDRIALQGFTGYRGGLDVKENTTGTHSVYTKHLDGCEIMFHVSTLLKYYPLDPQQVERKRHLGNDVILIIFREGKNRPFDMSTIRSQFNHVFFVVTPEKGSEGTRYRIEIGAKEGVAPFSPPLPASRIGTDKTSRNWLLSKLINAERAAFYAPSFVTKFRDTRKQQLASIVSAAKSEAPKKLPGSGIRRGLQTMRLKMSGSLVELPDNYFSSPTNFSHVAHLDNGTLAQFNENTLIDIFEPDVPYFKFDSPLKPPPGPPQETASRPPPEPPRGVSFGKDDGGDVEDEDIDDDDWDESPPSNNKSLPKKGNTWGSQNKSAIARPTISADVFKPPTGPQAGSAPSLPNGRAGLNGATPKRPAPPRPPPPKEFPKGAPPPALAGGNKPKPAAGATGIARKPSSTVPGPSGPGTPRNGDNNEDTIAQNGESGGSGGTSTRPPASRRLSRGAGRGGSTATLRGTKKLPPPPGTKKASSDI